MRFSGNCINLIRSNIVDRIDKNKTYGIFANTDGRIIESRIDNAGATVISLPVRECKKIELAETDRETLRRIGEFDWIIFTDIFSARYFIEALNSAAVDVSDLDSLKICAAGETTVHYLRQFQIHCDLVLMKSNAMHALAEFVGDKLENSRFLIPGDSATENSLSSELENIGVFVFKMPFFRTRPKDETDFARVKALLLGGAFDEIFFFNSDDIFHLLHLFPDQVPSELLKEIGILAADEDIFQSLTDFGLQPRYLHGLPL